MFNRTRTMVIYTFLNAFLPDYGNLNYTWPYIQISAAEVILFVSIELEMGCYFDVVYFFSPHM